MPCRRHGFARQRHLTAHVRVLSLTARRDLDARREQREHILDVIRDRRARDTARQLRPSERAHVRRLRLEAAALIAARQQLEWELCRRFLLHVLLHVLIQFTIGLGALRVRGLMLAVVTLGFALAAQQYLWRTNFFSDGNATSVPLPRGRVGPFDLSSQRSYYWFSLALLALVVLLVARLRRSGIGRIIIAVRDNPDSAAAYTVSPTRAKLIGFGLAGGIAGFAGGALGGLFVTISFNDLFDVDASFTAVAVAVIGGIGSIAGPILGALWVVGLPALWPDNELIPLLTSSVGLLILLMYFPGGLVQIGLNARDALLVALARRSNDGAAAARPSTATTAYPPTPRPCPTPVMTP